MDNLLEGSIHPNIGLMLPQLSFLAVMENKFSGPLPVSLSNASNLEDIIFSGNSFTGPVPRDLGRLQKLKALNMAGNQLGSTEGDDLSFIPSLANCTQLEFVIFEYNSLRGPLDSSLANLSARVIALRRNQIQGTIPAGIENLVNLEVLDISGNNLTGSIPTNIGKLLRLQELLFRGNMLIGRIPSSLGKLTLLNDLDLGNNNLFGEIPPSLGSLHNLLGLDLSDNNLNGSIPEELMGLSSLIVLFLSGNALTGLLPLEVGSLINLERLDVSENKLSGGLPMTLGKCVKLLHLSLNGNFFEEEIPILQMLRGLEYMDLSYNNFSGIIPAYLGELPFLTYLNLSFNELDGEVPTVGVFGNATKISVLGNHNICGGIPELGLPICLSPSLEKQGKHLAVKVVIPLAIAIPCLSLSIIFFIIYRWRRKLRKNISSKELSNNQFRRISYSDLHKATGGFSQSNIIGVGSYGSVYKGVLDQDGTAIAVKVLNLRQRGASKSFMLECKALRKIRHRNLIRVLSVCSSLDFHGDDFKALVFELMPHGSLERWLHPEPDEDAPKRLNLQQRFNIVVDVASALEYLHNHCDAVIVHSDLKPSNVLLDEDMTAHVGDFGLAKIFSAISSTIATGTGVNQSSSNAMKGSIGYIAPEYGVSGKVSIQGDIYSYGILLLEMFTGRRPTDNMFQDGLTLHNFVKMCLPERVMEVIDQPLLLEAGERGRMRECIVAVLSIGIACSMESPKDRMEIGDAINKLHSIKNLFLREAGNGEGRE